MAGQNSEGTFDNSGEIISNLLATELEPFIGLELNPPLIQYIKEKVAANIGIVGMWESAEILGVSRQRVFQLAKENNSPIGLPIVTEKQMPPMLARLRSGPLWLGKQVLFYAAMRQQK